MTTETNNTPPGWERRAEIRRTRAALVSFSTDVEDLRVLRVRFTRKHDERDRHAILNALNDAAASPETPARHLPSREEIGAIVRFAFHYASSAVCGGLYNTENAIDSAADAILSLLRGDTANGGEG